MASLGNPEELAKRIVEAREREPLPPVVSPPPSPKRGIQVWQVLLALAAVHFVFRMVASKSSAGSSPDVPTDIAEMEIAVETSMPVPVKEITTYSFNQAGTVDEAASVEKVDTVDDVASIEKVDTVREAEAVGGTFDSDVYIGQASEIGQTSGNSLPPFTDIDIDVEVGSVTVVQGTDYGASCSKMGVDHTFQWSVENGTLHILDEGNGGWNQWKDSYLEITLPDYVKLNSAFIHTSAGNISWEASCTVHEVDLSSDLGNISWNGVVSAQYLALDTDMGDVVFDGQGDIWVADLSTCMGDVSVWNLQTNTLTARTDMGNVEIQCAVDNFSYELDTDAGSVYINGDKQAGRSVGHVSDDVHYIEGHSSMGNVSLTF